ncbi:hypothetical protein PIB30_068557 [Stylosanthes scabra]|uniref:Uncharacterized protein n=1 Tax=Stylosanthes scabra TaxID=79078 RepID=A0ABU6SNM1_9FABA|nr:hypothetical protein [Stylosanthes scabra]
MVASSSTRPAESNHGGFELEETSRSLLLNLLNEAWGEAWCTADKLSQKTVGGVQQGCLSSVRRFCSHWTSMNVAAKARYSASVELRLTVGCFMHFHDTKLEPKKTQ